MLVQQRCFFETAVAQPAFPPGLPPYTARLNYLLFLPKGYSRVCGQHWPLILFLHGIGERGDTPQDLDRLLRYGIPRVAEAQPDFPFIALSPQCPSESYWPMLIDAIKILLDEVSHSEAVDPRRVYLTGVSMGGYGAWHLALAYPQAFAALAPVAGGYDPTTRQAPPHLCRLKDLPVWAFHGAQDNQVPPDQTRILIEGLRACGGNVRFTLYPDTGHDSWTRTYGNPSLYEWFLSNYRQVGDS